LARNTPDRRKKGVHWSSELDAVTLECVELMLDNKWEIGRSHLALAKKHGRSASDMGTIAASASRFIRLCRGREDEVKERILQAIDQGVKLAIEADKVAFSGDGEELRAKQPDLRALTGFLQLQIEVHGLGRTHAKDKPSEDKVKLPIDELNELLGELGLKMVKKDGESSNDSGGE
jgi:hypothetical protein